MTIRNSSQARRAKAVGRDAENKVVEWLKEVLGFANVERRRLSGVEDCGDIAGCPGLVVEVKGGRQMTWPKFIAELEAEIENANKRFPGDPHNGFVVKKKMGTTDVDDWYITMTGKQFREFLLRWYNQK